MRCLRIGCVGMAVIAALARGARPAAAGQSGARTPRIGYPSTCSAVSDQARQEFRAFHAAGSARTGHVWRGHPVAG